MAVGTNIQASIIGPAAFIFTRNRTFLEQSAGRRNQGFMAHRWCRIPQQGTCILAGSVNDTMSDDTQLGAAMLTAPVRFTYATVCSGN